MALLKFLLLLTLASLWTLALADLPLKTTIGSPCKFDKDCNNETLFCSLNNFRCDLLDNLILEEQQIQLERLEKEAQKLTEQLELADLNPPEQSETPKSAPLNCIAYEQECRMVKDTPVEKPCCIGLYCMAKPGSMLQIGLDGNPTSINSNTYRNDPLGILVSEGRGICMTGNVVDEHEDSVAFVDKVKSEESPSSDSEINDGAGIIGPLGRAILEIAFGSTSFDEEQKLKIEDINCTNQIVIVRSGSFRRFEADEENSAMVATSGLSCFIISVAVFLIRSL